MIKPLNPFIIGHYESDEYFCDRVDETSTLEKHIENGRHVSLISARRLGKTGLIEHLFSQPHILETYYTFFVDIYATSSLAEFVALLGKEIFEKLKPQSSIWSERFLQMVSSLRPGVKIDSMTGDLSFDLGLGEIQSPQTSLDEIFDYLEQADRRCIVAIDEFQQIANYDEKNIEALLRTKIQHCKNVIFIYTGSKRHMMSQMFHSPSKPFYQSTVGMSLKPIPKDVYCEFSCGLFRKYNKNIEKNVVEEIYERYEGYTWYMQMILNELFAITNVGEICTLDYLTIAKKNIILSQSEHYIEITANLATKQKTLLKAMAKECFITKGWINSLTSSTFIKKYSLTSASSVQSALKGLMDKDVVTSEDSRYRISDFFFMEWYACR